MRLATQVRPVQPTFNIVKLADELAEIARTARDDATGNRLLRVVDRLLVEAGLPAVTDAARITRPSRSRSKATDNETKAANLGLI